MVDVAHSSSLFSQVNESEAPAAARGTSRRERRRHARRPLSQVERAALKAEAEAADARVKELVRRQRAASRDMAIELHGIWLGRLYEVFCFADVVRYARSRGVPSSASQVMQQVRMVEDLRHQPLLRETFVRCEADWTAVREASRAAKARPELEAELAVDARTLSVREIERKARQLRGEPELEVRRFELPSATIARLDQAFALVRVANPAASDEDALDLIAHAFVQGGSGHGEPGAATSRVVLHCEVPATCARATGVAIAGEAVAHGSSVATSAAAPGASATRADEATKAQAALDAACASVSVSIEGREGRVEVPRAALEEALCDAEISDVRRGPSRITRTVPPRTARHVHDRDRGRCRAPNCVNLGQLHQHHQGGRRVVGHDPLFMLTSCSVHHRMIHEGTLGVAVVPGGFMFSLPDGSAPVFVPYEPSAVAAVVAPRDGTPLRAPAATPARTPDEEDAVAALVALELKKRDAVEAVRLAAQTLRGRGVPTLDAGALVHEALRALPPPPGPRKA